MNLPPEPVTTSRTKVFGIGAHRTGTSSLTSALRILGYRASHWEDRHLIHRDTERGNYRLGVMDQFDAVSDLPIPTIWRQLAEAFPAAKFILTRRTSASWVASAESHMKGRALEREEVDFYGQRSFVREAFLMRYERHNAEVLDYFSGQRRFLDIDITAGEGWEKLCPFLEVPVTSSLPNFPWEERLRS